MDSSGDVQPHVGDSKARNLAGAESILEADDRGAGIAKLDIADAFRMVGKSCREVVQIVHDQRLLVERHEALAGSDCSEPVLTRALETADIGMKIGRPRTYAEVTERMQHGSQRNCLSKGTDRHHFFDPIAPISVRRHRQHGVDRRRANTVHVGP